jgi:hypothetical protein
MVQQFSANRIIGQSILGLCKGILPESGEKGEILLVFGFMPNGSLDKTLYES